MPQNGQRDGAEDGIQKSFQRNSTVYTSDTSSVLLSNSQSNVSTNYQPRVRGMAELDSRQSRMLIN